MVESKKGSIGQIRQTFYREIGGRMVSDIPAAENSLISIYGVILLIIIKQGDGVRVTSRDYERMKKSFISFHTTKFPPSDQLVQKYLQEPEVFDGYIEGLVSRGFVDVSGDLAGNKNIALTEQGQVEVSLFEAQSDIERAEKRRNNSVDEVSPARRKFSEAAEARFAFWKKRVAQGVKLTDSEKERIIRPTTEYGYGGLLPYRYYQRQAKEKLQALTLKKK